MTWCSWIIQTGGDSLDSHLEFLGQLRLLRENGRTLLHAQERRGGIASPTLPSMRLRQREKALSAGGMAGSAQPKVE